MHLPNLTTLSATQAWAKLLGISIRAFASLLLPIVSVGFSSPDRRTKYDCRWYMQKLGIVTGLIIYIRLATARKGIIKASIPQCKTPIFLRAGTSDVWTFEEVFINEEYRLPVAALPNLIVDGGANIGLVSLYFANKYANARIMAIEPDGSNVELLKANTKNYPNVTVLQAGIWNHRGRLKIENPNDDKWAFRVQPTDSSNESVEAVRIDDILEMADAESVDILKLDIEGAEREVFSDSQRWVNKCGVILVELHDRFKPGCAAALEAAISSHNFQRYQREEIRILVRKNLPEPKQFLLRQIPRDLISNFLSSEYELTQISSPTVLSGGMESAVWSISANEGEWIVKAFAPHQGPFERIAEEVRLYDHLNANGIRAPSVRPNAQGALVSKLIFANESYPIIVMRREQLLKLLPSSITSSQLSAIASAQARMHAVLEKYDQGASPLSSPNLKPTIKAFAKLATTPNVADFSKTELERFKAIDKWMVDYAIAAQPKRPLIESILHSDMSLEHAQFLPDGEVYFFDFADRSRGPVAYGIATALLHLYTGDHISLERWEQLKSWLLEGYNSICELRGDDLNAIRPFLIIRLLDEIAYLSETAAARSAPVDVTGVRRRYRLAEHVLNGFSEGLLLRMKSNGLGKRVLAIFSLLSWDLLSALDSFNFWPH